MILKNKLTKETLDIPYSEFRKNSQKKSKLHLKVIGKHSLINILTTLKTIILWSLIFILTSNGILIILGCQTGLLKECKMLIITGL